MMLRWSLGRAEAAEAIEAAVGDALADGYRTRDLLPAGGRGRDPVSAREMARIVGERIAIRRPVTACGGPAARSTIPPARARTLNR